LIDTTVEDPIPIVQLSQLYPHKVPGTRGKPVSPMTVENWTKKGIRGIKLEVLVVGGRLCTSLAALDRFYQEVTRSKVLGDRPGWGSSAWQGRSNKARQRAAEKASKRLEEAGA